VNEKMEKLIIILTMMLLGIGNVSAQKNINVRDSIASREMIISKAKKGELPKLLRRQIEDYKLLVLQLSDKIDNYSTENKNLREKLHNIMLLTLNDTTVFRHKIKDITDVPVCLKERTELICHIIELEDMIVAAEETASKLEQSLGKTPVAYAAIGEKLEQDLNKIQALIQKIKGMNLSDLSKEQQRYFKPGLTERYNKFSKYFE